jgi:hypothetical protein
MLCVVGCTVRDSSAVRKADDDRPACAGAAQLDETASLCCLQHGQGGAAKEVPLKKTVCNLQVHLKQPCISIMLFR